MTIPASRTPNPSSTSRSARRSGPTISAKTIPEQAKPATDPARAGCVAFSHVGCRELSTGSVPGSEQPTGLHELKESEHGFHRASGHRQVPVPRRRRRGVQALVRAVHGDRPRPGHGDAAVRHLLQRRRDGVHRHRAVPRLRSAHPAQREPRPPDGRDHRHGIGVGELLGEPSAELRARFTGGGPVQLFTPWATM